MNNETRVNPREAMTKVAASNSIKSRIIHMIAFPFSYHHCPTGDVYDNACNPCGVV